MNATEILVDHFIGTSYEDIDEKTLGRAKWRLLDSLGVMVVGARAIGVDAVRSVLTRMGGAAEATVLGFGDRLPVANAAMLNSLMMRSFDFDTVMNVAFDGEILPSHLGACSVPALLAASEYQKSSGRDTLAALVLGDDFGARLTICSEYAPTGLFDNTGTTSGMAAAVAAAKLYGLNKEQFVSALGLMVNMVTGSTMNVMQACMTFKYPMANASRSAIYASEFAKQGYTAMKDPITDPKGFFTMYCGKYNTTDLLKELGNAFLSDAVIKPWPGCRETHMGVNAVLAATGGVPIDPEAIESFKVYLDDETPSFLIAPYPFGDTNQVRGAFSGTFTAASAALNGYLRPESYSPEMMADPKLDAMLQKMDIQTASLQSLWHSKAEIVLKDGAIYESDVEYTLGDFDHSPLSEDQILDKYYHNIDYSGLVSRKQAEKAVDIVMHLEDCESIEELLSCFVG